MKDSEKRLLILSLGMLAVIGGPMSARSAERKESFARDLALAGWSQKGDDIVVFLVKTRTREYMRLKNHEPGPDGTKVKTVRLADRRADTFVELERNDETAILRCDDHFIRCFQRVEPLLRDKDIQLKQFFLENGKLILGGRASSISHAMKFLAGLTNDAGLHQFTWMFPQPTILDDNQASFRAEGTLNAGGESHEGQ